MFGFYRIATCTPVVRVADVAFNCEHLQLLAIQARQHNAAVALFPELTVTAASCGDLFLQPTLLRSAEDAVRNLTATLPAGTIFVIGAPVSVCGRLYDAAVVIQNGRLLGIVPKSVIPARCDKRWFASGRHNAIQAIDYAGQTNVPFGTDLLFQTDSDLVFGLEIGDDTDAVIPPAATLALNGATLILTPAADTEQIGRAAKRAASARERSARCLCATATSSAGVCESTTDAVCGGHQLVAENGALLLDSPRFLRTDTINVTDVDLQRINALRLADSSFRDTADTASDTACRIVRTAPVPDTADCLRIFPRHPFVPADPAERADACREILAIQTAGLAKRVEHAHAQKLVLGISGGLDSTLALLVCVETMRLLNRPASDVITVTMPGFGTTDRTYNNACGLCRGLGTDLREISIKQACLVHFQDINHDPATHNVVYENSQARERTQILLDLANQVNGLAVGTGDLSEAAMGWCTYNGDHISMYGVNADVPKTLIRHIISWYGDSAAPQIRAFLQDVIDTPVSPELIPPDPNGQIKQKTEDIIGPYEVHDFFLYHFLKYGASPDKILFLATAAFQDTFTPEQLRNFLNGFLRRFFTQQFKRSCSPDGPKVGSIALSPRGALHMPSDATNHEWVATL